MKTWWILKLTGKGLKVFRGMGNESKMNVMKERNLRPESKRHNGKELVTQRPTFGILNSTAPVRPLRDRLNSIPVVKSVVETMPMVIWRGKNICIVRVGGALLVTLITPAAV